MKNKDFNVIGMSCAACSARVQNAVDKLEGVESCQVNLLKNTMNVKFNDEITDEESIIKAVKKAGYNADIRDNTDKSSQSEKLNKKSNKIFIRLVLSASLVLILMVISMGHMVGIHIFNENQNVVKGIVELLITIPVVLLNFKYFTSGFKGLIKLSPNMDSLIAVGSAASLIYSTYLIVKGGAGHYYFESAAMILTFVTIGKYLESKSKAKTTEAVTKLVNLKPKTSIIIVDGKEVVIESEKIQKGDIVVVKSGMTFPVDGTIIHGDCLVDESTITGESMPVSKTLGGEVIGGTQLVSGYVRFKAERIGEETTLAGIIRLVDQATNTKPKIARFADKISRVFVPFVFLIAIISALVWFITTKDFELSLNFSIAVLVISCPCALGLATPTAIMVGTGKAAELGILVKSAEIFEVGDKVKYVMFDKTGTITKGMSEVTDFVYADGYDKHKLISVAAIIEKTSDHPLARAIVDYDQSPNKNLIAENIVYIPSKGISAVVEGDNYLLGNFDFVKEIANGNLMLSDAVNFSKQGKTSVFMCKNNNLVAIFGISDMLKDNVVEAVELLHDNKVNTLMITGDNELTAKEICTRTGIKDFKAELLPADKNTIIHTHQNNAPVIMVGDGINDSPALAAADIGIAVGTGTDIALESADVVLIRDDLRDVHTVIRLCRKVMRNIKENLFWALVYNLICIPIAAGVFYPIWGFQLQPMYGTIAMSLSSVCVVSNALRIKRFKRDYSIRKENKMKTVYIEGMMCPHCQNRVREILSAFDANVAVDLDNKCARISESVDNNQITDAINNAGYKVVEIK